MKRLMWPGCLFVLVGAIVVLDVTMIIVANTRTSLAVDAGYDTDADSVSNQQKQRRANARLGWIITARQAGHNEGLMLHIADRDDNPVELATVRVRMFHRADAKHVLSTTLLPGDDGWYHGQLPLERAGRWQCDVDAQVGADRFTDSLIMLIEDKTQEPTS